MMRCRRSVSLQPLLRLNSSRFKASSTLMERPWKRQNLSLHLDEFERYSDKIIIDRISELPDALLFQILSFLQMQDAMQVCCVSTRWKHLWKSVPCIDFTKEKIQTAAEFIRAVNKAQSQQEGLQIR
ncbi:putative F-box domain-containing protein [Dioscorea sansibarensis]